MDLHTHAFFGFAIGLIFFGRPDAALLVCLGAILPDLDREYWFVPIKMYVNEQYHRALFHNVFFMGFLYLLSPFLALGVFLHMLLDSFTTSKDRGCEWFFPLSRLVKRGRYNCNREDNWIKINLDPKERVYFYHEDLEASVEYPEPSLEQDPEPWRRTYGPALNSSLLDRMFLFGSIIFIIVWFTVPNLSNLNLWTSNSIDYYLPFIVAYFSIAVFFFAGELDRRDQEAPLNMTLFDPFKKISFLKKPLFILGIVLLGCWLFLFSGQIIENIAKLTPNWLATILSVLLVVVSSLVILKIKTVKTKPPAVV